MCVAYIGLVLCNSCGSSLKAFMCLPSIKKELKDTCKSCDNFTFAKRHEYNLPHSYFQEMYHSIYKLMMH